MLSNYQNEKCIAVYNLRKRYSEENTYAVDGITFDVKYGTVLGFLGPNGAFYPAEGLPAPLSAAFYINPLTYIVDISRAGIFSQINRLINFEVIIIGFLAITVFLIATRSMIKMKV